MRPPSKLERIDEDEEGFSKPTTSLRKADMGSCGSWKDGFDTFEDYQVNATDTYRIYSAGKEGPIVFCIHGAGASGLSFTLLANYCKSFCRIYAPDLRCHGHTHVKDEKDLSAGSLTQESIMLLDHILPNTPENRDVPIILFGHSMGGGIAVHVASDPSMRERIKGLIVVDVVEGTALEALPTMLGVLQRRPQQFYDYEDAINWSVDSHLLHNRASARISIPDQLVDNNHILLWRTNLFETEPFWKGWYEHMSDRFLQSPAVKMLILAGRERMDTPLTIGHMQGKFQLELQNGMGHYVHEDAPQEIARILQRYLKRYGFMGH